MAGTAALMAGCWLLVTSWAGELPPPFLSIHPTQGLVLGDPVTFRCHLYGAAHRVRLCQDQRRVPCMDLYGIQGRYGAAEFNVSGSREHAGSYRCQYQTWEPMGTSEESQPVEMVLMDPTFPPPHLSFPLWGDALWGQASMGSNVTLHCRTYRYGAAVLLHQDGRPAPILQRDPNGDGVAAFTLYRVTPQDSGSYRCSYRPIGFPFLLSPIGDNVTLKVTPSTEEAGPAQDPHVRLLLLSLLCSCLVTFIPILIISVIIITARRRHQGHGPSPIRTAEAEQIQVPCSDWDSLTYVELRVDPPDPTTTPRPHRDPKTIYAAVRPQ
ncbi:alpha-1B-glycoprotein-like [Excalfactoria chinensis]|uniref:alpha-1B-glycoprotein-like n=1 Tax=Excalfactoria chinensis TaxID=46218 RepID=UPI003B3A847A